MKSTQTILDFVGQDAFRPAPEHDGDMFGGVDIDLGAGLDLADFDTVAPVLATEQVQEELSKPRRVQAHDTGVCAQHAVNLAARIVAGGPGVTRAILAGTFIFGDFIQAVVAAYGPAKVKLSTLSYSAENVDALWTSFQDGHIESLDFITSDFFYSHYRDTLWKMLVTNLPRERCRYAVAGSHAKVCVIHGREHTCVIEGSANLRSCQNVEQVLISVDDAEAVRFHSKWIDRIIDRFGLTWKKMGNKDVWNAITGV